MKKTTSNRFIFLLYILMSIVLSGQIACLGDKGSEDESTESDDPDETETGTDPTTLTCQEYIDANFSSYASGVTECICVGTDAATWCPSDGDQETSGLISDALTERATTSDPVVILLDEATFDETISLTNANYSNTYFIGTGEDETDTTITYSSPTGVTDQVIEMDSNVNTIGFYNLIIDGIGTEVTAVDTSDNLQAGTVVITDSTSITFEDVTFTDNYFRALYISGSSATVTIKDADLNTFVTGPTGSDYETATGIWNEGSLTVYIENSTYAFDIDTTAYVGIINTGAGNQLECYNCDLSNSQVAEILLLDTENATITTSELNGSQIGIYAEDVIQATLDSLYVNGPTYGFVGCQTNSSADPSLSTYTFTNCDRVSGSGTAAYDLEALYFGNVTIEGSNNDAGSVYSNGTTFNGDISATDTHSKGCDVSEYY